MKIHDEKLNKTFAFIHIAYTIALNREKCHVDIFFTDFRSAGVVALRRVTYASTCVIVSVSSDIRSSIVYQEKICALTYFLLKNTSIYNQLYNARIGEKLEY